MPKGRRTPTYLKKVSGSQNWYANIPCPKHLRAVNKKKGGEGEVSAYLRTTGTPDWNEARRRLPAIQVEAYAHFAKLEAKLASQSSAHLRDPGKLRDYLRTAIPTPYVPDPNSTARGSNLHPDLDALVDHLEDAHAGDVPPALVHVIQDHIAARLSLPDLLEDYLAKRPKRSPGTASNYRTVVAAWVADHGSGPLRPPTRRELGAWLNHATEGLSPNTARRYVRVLATLFDWQHRTDERDARPVNPFSDARDLMDDATRPTGKSYRAYGRDELAAVFLRLQGERRDLLNAALIMLYSGMRPSEAHRAERVTVHGVPCFSLPRDSGKTDNAARMIPVHPCLADVFIDPAGRSETALSVAFGRFIKPLRASGAVSGDDKVFYSLRKNFATALEQSGCPEAVAARLMGHAPGRFTYRVYSSGQEVHHLAEWVNSIAYDLPRY
jgi:integrase